MIVIVHQLDANDLCQREFRYYPETALKREALYARIERGFNMARTMVTVGDRYEFGRRGDHEPDDRYARLRESDARHARQATS